MTKKTFFEHLGVAHIERIHSQMLAWIFSKDCEAINPKDKTDLLAKIFQLSGNRQILNVETEHNNIDILIQTDQEIIIIENKIKSSQHSNQLSDYHTYCEQKFNREPLSFYLTLIGENPYNEKWRRISYDTVYSILKDAELSDSNHAIILIEYLNYLSKLTSVTKDFQLNPQKYDLVFLDGKKKKSEKVQATYNNDYEKFIAENQLETILQRCFLNSLKEKMPEFKSYVTETRGSALIDFILKEGIIYNDNCYSTMIQLQRDTIKFAFVISGDPHAYARSSKELVKEIIPKMKNISLSNSFNYNRCNKPTNKAYISISKKLNEHYWHLNFDELVELIKGELANGIELTQILENQLN